MELSQLCAANYHYKRYTLDYFLESAERLGYQSIELWASGPHLHLEDFDTARLAELNRKICLLYTSPSPRDYAASRMPSSA